MSISPNVTRRSLLTLTSAFALLPLAGCQLLPEDTPEPALVEDGLLVASDHSPVAGNAAWCAPMQICWDMFEERYNEGEALSEDGMPEIVTELNNAHFERDMLGEDHYVTYAGPQTYEAKSEIESLIKDRFDQTSDILDRLEWAEDPTDALFLFYAMLFRTFTFEYAFDVLEEAPFGSSEGGNLHKNVAYFGADESSEEPVLDQVYPLFWEADDHCAVRIYCKEGDVLYLARGLSGSTFDELWNDLTSSTESNSALLNVRSFACPKLDLNVLTEYTELEGLEFPVRNGGSARIESALQTLRLSLDENGGTIKSEAAIAVNEMALIGAEELHCDFRFDDSFTLFLVDSNATGEHYPYAALFVHTIDDFLQES